MNYRDFSVKLAASGKKTKSPEPKKRLWAESGRPKVHRGVLTQWAWPRSVVREVYLEGGRCWACQGRIGSTQRAEARDEPLVDTVNGLVRQG